MSEKKSIVKSTTLVVVVMLLSRALGFLREAVVAAIYGSTLFTDIYFVSSEFMIDMCGAFTDALTMALVTVCIATAAKQGKQEAGRLASKVLTLYLLFTFVVILGLNVGATTVAKILAPAYTTEQLQILAHYLRLFSAAFIFSAIQSNYAAVQNANNIFVPAKMYGVFFNPLAIVLILFFGEKIGISALVYAFYISNMAQCILLCVTSRKIYHFRPSLRIRDQQLKQIALLTLPILASNIVIQFNGVLDKALCSFIGQGAASSYTYAFTLDQFVDGTFTMTVMLVLLSSFSEMAAKKETEQLTQMTKKTISALLLLLLPVVMISVIKSHDIVAIVYERGEFTQENTIMTQQALIGFAIGFPIIGLREVMRRVHFAFQEARTPMFISIIGVILNAVMSIVLCRYIGILGITLATSLSAILSVVLLTVTSKKYIPDFRFFSLWRDYIKMMIALVISWLITVQVHGFFAAGNLLLSLVMCTFIGFAVYFLLLLLMRSSIILEVLETCKQRIWKQKA